MILHKNLCLAIIDGLHQICNEQQYADKVVNKLLKRDRRWGSRDRHFIAETLYTIVRYQRLYAEIAQIKAPYKQVELWRFIAVWATLKGIALPKWEQFLQTPTRKIKGRFDELSKIRVFKESLPDWLDKLGEQELGTDLWSKEINKQNQQADVILRVNTLKTDKEKLQLHLRTEGIDTEFISGYPLALKLIKRANVFNTHAYKQGWFEVQDASSQLVADYLQVQPGMKVVDACAGAGGKTLHLAALMQNKGQIIAMDIYESKLKQLKKRAKRNGVFNVSIRLINSTKVIKKLYNKADRLLIDAPCSGLGVLRRTPDAKWKLTPQFIKNVKQTQQEILQHYSKMLKPGGKMVYATCSILPSENRKQIDNFLNSQYGASFKFITDKSILAHQSNFDGFYMALLQKKSEI